MRLGGIEPPTCGLKVRSGVYALVRLVGDLALRRPFRGLGQSPVWGCLRLWCCPTVAPAGQDVIPGIRAAEPVVHLLDVDVHRGREPRVAEPALHLLERLPVVQQQRPARLTERMERDPLVVPHGVAVGVLADLDREPRVDERRAQNAVVDIGVVQCGAGRRRENRRVRVGVRRSQFTQP
jgi:hypothetical protein